MARKRPISSIKRIPSGVPGLDPLLNGGLIEHSSALIVGTAGAGKTTAALQFLMKGLSMGSEGIFVSLDENKDQIIREAEALGWHSIRELIEREKVIFIDATGRKFSQFIKRELPDFVEQWKGLSARIVIDPLTPVIWAVPDRYEQRELISFLLKETRKVGTVMATLEEHTRPGDLLGPETVIPVYLSDTVVHLYYTFSGDVSVRRLRVIKCRRTAHSHMAHRYQILPGVGVVVIPPIDSVLKAPVEVVDALKNRTLSEVQYQRLVRALSVVRAEEMSDTSIQQLIDLLLRE